MERGGKSRNMEENGNIVNFEEIHDSEFNDIWDIFFPNVVEKREKLQKRDLANQTKPRRYLKFLTM